MQTLILKNEGLKKEIEELERKIELLSTTEAAPAATTAKKTGKFGTLLKKAGAGIGGLLDERRDSRSPKTLEAIRQLHELLLAGRYDQAQDFIKDKKKVLFGKPKKGVAVLPLDLTDDYGETVLQKAVKLGNTKAVDELLDMGASIDVPDSDGETPLMTAAKYGHLAMVRLLVSRANRDAKTKYTKKTALHFAAQYGHVEVVQVLLDNGCDATLEDVDGNTALQVAKDKTVFKIINKVVKKHSPGTEGEGGAEEDDEEMALITGKDDYDAFKKMKKERSYSQDEEMKPLLAETKELENKKQLLQLQYDDLKSKRGPKDNFDILKSLDTSARRKFLGFDNTPKDKMTQEYHDLVLKGDSPGALEDVEKMLTEKNKKNRVDKDAPDEFGETALMKASRLGYGEMLDLLLMYKCGVDLKDMDGYTAIMKAAQFGKHECVQKLINEGADLNLTTRNGKYTALMLAAQRGHGKICELLIAEGANHALMDSDGKRAVDLALNPDAKEMIQGAMEEHPVVEANVQI